MEDSNSTLADLSIKRGTIFHSDIFEEIDHGKFFVIIGETDEQYIGFFYINSNINRFIQNKQILLDLQYPLLKRNYSFLDYDSFLGCHEITPIPKDKLKETIVDRRTKIKGELLTEDIEQILSTVRASKLFTQKEKDTYFK